MDASHQDHDVLELLIGFAQVGREWSQSINRVAGFDVSDNRSIPLLSRLAIDGTIRPGEIAQLTGLTSGGVTKLVARLEQRGLVERSVGAFPSDRRAVFVTLTPKGIELAAEFATEFRLQMVLLEPIFKELSRFSNNE